jgi:Domain of unknown function (DUF4123)
LATATAATCHERVLAILRQPGSTLYGLIDAAQDPEILALIREGECPFDSLYQGESAIVMASVAPYLIQLDSQKGLLEKLITRGWGHNWGLYVRSRLPLKELRHHFRHFTMVELPDRQTAYFRFYDPRVFRVFILTCNISEIHTIFEGIEVIYCEEPDGTSMNLYRPPQVTNAKPGDGRLIVVNVDLTV